jgi:hypothetical protein
MHLLVLSRHAFQLFQRLYLIVQLSVALTQTIEQQQHLRRRRRGGSRRNRSLLPKLGHKSVES